jgi:hypothetical protein
MSQPKSAEIILAIIRNALSFEVFTVETGTVKLRKALTNMSRMVMPALLTCRNIFRLSGPQRHLDHPDMHQ